MTSEPGGSLGSGTITERRLSPAYLVISTGRTVRALIPAIAVGIWQLPGWAIAIAAGLVLLHSFALWWVRRYSVADGSFRVRGGLLKRTDDTIGVHRISSLDAERGVLQRLLGVWGVKIRTPGNDHRSAIHLPSLSAGALEQLRAALRQPGPQVVGITDRTLESGSEGTGIARPTAGSSPFAATPVAAPPGVPRVAPPPVTAGPVTAGPVTAGPVNSAADAGPAVAAVVTSTFVAGPAVADPGQGSAAGPPVVLAVLSTRTLLVAAVTGTSVPLILAGAVATFGRARDLLPDRVFDRLARQVFVGGSTTALLLLAAAVLAVLAGIALTSLRLAKFTLVRDGNRLRISRGLLAQRSGSIPVARVQAVRLVEGSWRRMLGYCALEVEVAGLSSSSDTERMLFPLVRTADAADLVRRALPELGWTPRPLTAVPRRARRRYFTLPVLLALPVTAALTALPGWGAYLAALPVPAALLIGWGQSADAAWALDETTVILRWRRVLARHTVVAGRGRVQLTEISATPWQRRANLAGVRLLLTNRRRARVRHLDAADALMVLHRVGRRLDRVADREKVRTGPARSARHVP